MGHISSSIQHFYILPHDRNAHGDTTPLFMKIEPNTIETIELASLLYQSLVDFVAEGNIMDSETVKQTCTILQKIADNIGRTAWTHRLLFELVPTRDDSCSGFTESIVSLLTSSNEKLVKSALWLLLRVFRIADPPTLYHFLQTGFFALLPNTFYTHEMHLFVKPSLSLMKIMNRVISCADPSSAREICKNKRLSMTIVHQTFRDKFFQPIKPFLEFISRNRRRIEDSEYSWDFSWLFAAIIQRSPFLEEITQFVLSSSFALGYTDSLQFFKTNTLSIYLLRSLKKGLRAWRKEGPAVQKRGQQIMAKLREEGISDEIELPFQHSVLFNDRRHNIFLGIQLIDLIDGNVPYLGEMEIHE